MAYHYEECGLDNVYLENGFSFHETPYGKGVSFHDAEGLHKAIAASLIEQPCPLIGAELRFLRHEMELSQKNLAAILGVDEQALRRWEKARSKSFNGAADRLLRVLYNDHENGDGAVKRMVERMAELDCVERQSIRLIETNAEWRAAA